MRYVIARYHSHQREMAYRIYCAECLRMATENTARMVSGSYMKLRFEELLKNKPVDRRTADEIVADTIKNAGLEVR